MNDPLVIDSSDPRNLRVMVRANEFEVEVHGLPICSYDRYSKYADMGEIVMEFSERVLIKLTMPEVDILIHRLVAKKTDLLEAQKPSRMDRLYCRK